MKVLVPVDGSENALRAAKYVLNMAKSHKSQPSFEVTLLAVACQYDASYFADYWVGQDIPNQKCREIFTESLTKAKKLFDYEDISVKTELLEGDPGNVIVSYIEEKGIDKVVMGSRGLGPFKGLILGSVTYKVLNNVNVPVTIVK